MLFCHREFHCLSADGLDRESAALFRQQTPAVHFVYCIMSDANCQFSKSFPGAIDILCENPV